jgi:hypothetical protein
MQDELDALGLPVTVGILGVNGSGHESGNAGACEGRDIPWLQETPSEPVWARWQVAYRDVIVLDEDNVPVAIYNLTEHDLWDPANYEELKTMLVTAAGGGATP